ncbi:hypothetical protein [Deinococcus radiophilus]|uniref:Uncharacterized protein n=1 Tax=Deinococcus radiophilus TaxID=32062 RepID=A0A3S0KEA3_9DEIO|nr:hypothetical protein [Deinococcus radiophilus]RTR28612.1 hypothetical protein EJ104_04450 [Deinococcus radiophilus]UFA51034.1 hypothetical protein LMT64_03810 [Deinococcus radiophilus]
MSDLPPLSAPNDADIQAEFIRVVSVGGALDGRLWLEVGLIRWTGPHTPALTWQVADSLPAGASAEAVTTAQTALLNDARYFAVCERCGRRCPQGWMLDGVTCQACAERFLEHLTE